jgi:hypothetical protein
MKNRKGIITIGFNTFYADLPVVLEIEDLLVKCHSVSQRYLDSEGIVLVQTDGIRLQTELTKARLITEKEYDSWRDIEES